mmetsp:Transcript_61428/g.183076  ORF Transcript_61428/g.183076 Transcript_61428/m.183076 type:complete len:233 (-) Transcript_61428:395-1093(-)
MPCGICLTELSRCELSSDDGASTMRVGPLPEPGASAFAACLGAFPPCIQPITSARCSSACSSSASMALVESAAMATSFATAFSSSANSLALVSSRSASSSAAWFSPCSSSWSSFVYLKICLHRWRTTPSSLSSGVSAITEISLLSRMLKTTITTIRRRINPMFIAASMRSGLVISKDSCTFASVSSSIEALRCGAPNWLSIARDTGEGWHLKSPPASSRPMHTLKGPYRHLA